MPADSSVKAVRGEVHVANLFPTSRYEPDPERVVETRLPFDVIQASRITAACQCRPGTPESEQYANLVIQIEAPGGGAVYRGPLRSLSATLPDAANNVVVRVWLADNGRAQREGVTTRWSFMATPVPLTV